jgi:PAS domain S-box-containing protein
MDNTFGLNIIPENENERLQALFKYKILGTPAEQAFDNVARLATQVFNVPISLISLIDSEEVYFKANVGMGKDKTTSRGVSLCSIAILKPEVTVFTNARLEQCLLTNPNVADELGLQFYAGAPLTTPDGFRIGTLCIIDKNPREFSPNDELILVGLAKIAMDEIELRLNCIDQIGGFAELNEKLAAANEKLAVTNEELIASLEELDRSKAQTELVNKQIIENQKRLYEMFKHAPIGLGFFSTSNYVIEYANESLCNIWNKGTPGQVAGKFVFDLVPELEANGLRAVFDQVIKSEKPFVSEEAPIISHTNGLLETSYFDFHFAPVYNNEKEVTGLVALINNVTEQVEAKRHLNVKNSELDVLVNQFEFLTNSIPQQVWTATPDGALDYVNNQVQLFCGKQPDQIIGDNWQYLVHPEDLPDAGKAWMHSLSTGDTYHTEFRLRDKDDVYKWHLARAQPFIKDGRVIKWFGTNTDIEEQKQLAERKDAFISVASHELKTPLTSLSASMQLLSRIYNKDKESLLIPTFIDKSNANLKKLINLVDDLMNVSKLQHGKLLLKRNTFKLAHLIKEVCDDFGYESTHTYNMKLDATVEVFADYQRITQVVINMVSNAIKYAPNSKIINIELKEDGNFARVSVQDFGIGISAEKHHLLFDRYYRVNDSGIEFSGLGIGLHICAEMIDRHEGQIGVESTLEKGSTFWFKIPLLNS